MCITKTAYHDDFIVLISALSASGQWLKMHDRQAGREGVCCHRCHLSTGLGGLKPERVQLNRHGELLARMPILRLPRIRGPNYAKVHRGVHQSPVAASGRARRCILLSAFVIVSWLPLVRRHCSPSRNTTPSHRIGVSADLSRKLLLVSSLLSFMTYV